MSNNEEILKQLEETEGTDNVEVVLNKLSYWDKNEFEFPVDELIRYIKMHQWDYQDFSFEMETVLMSVLPKYIHDIFFDMKEFRNNTRNELTSTCEAFARIKAWPRETQDEKAYCQYMYSYTKYYENSTLHKGE